ncbi:MAG: hypothetical protein GW762_05500 [Candidatus Pacebacteria bacterium]|nr:hypothetical protein [Candidatus Paceibacterota bacterium]PIR63889.1 MAG: hypothetical protein COU64_02870 [Candidatus Pacebacteria bacterium CG10_big_fil_rev_8_21_14_0_10_40_26]PIZ78334.1 MAG: hypothetical protein COY01_06160 [Candidatus Pacebacteria bacterium CG_4_10_14_0_2_um_filter_40_20]PJA68622.1 MAG: hypothetical protein CO156_03885 [Candidatus Pacebacteria bacterium CG_4_9_14_3_um_filter_40_12]PJC41562.1 MAG: hypothetical protein CO041_02475 [Candidatus Pacebacteria bacterium CG_4_9_
MPQMNSAGPNLTYITFIARKAVIFGSVGLVTLIVGRVVITTAVAWWKTMNPPPPPPPTVGFGILPALTFPEQDAEDKPLSYKLETPNGTTPYFSDRAKVFLVQHAAPNLLADENAKKQAATYGYVFEPDKLPGNIYRWSKTTPIQSTFEYNILSGHMRLTTDYLSRPELLTNPDLPTGFDAVKKVKDFLKKGSLLGADMATASGEISYLKALGDDLETAVSPSDADFIQVDLNRTPIDSQYRMYTPNGFEGIVTAILTGSLPDQDMIVYLKSGYHVIDYSIVHTYPLRSSADAWKLLKAGEGYIADPGDDENVVIRDIQLGYFDTNETQDYLQPVYVFYNPEDGFLGYVPALDPQFTQSEQ